MKGVSFAVKIAIINTADLSLERFFGWYGTIICAACG